MRGGRPDGARVTEPVGPIDLVSRIQRIEGHLSPAERQALLALQAFAGFLATHRQSTNLEAEIRRNLRREGIVGAIEIILHHEPRDLGS